jgi:hypothetical protein
MSEKKVPERRCCASCGTKAPSGALFCPHCGELLDPSQIYDEIISSIGNAVEEAEEIGEKASVKYGPPPVFKMGALQLVYGGTIQGLVTGESRLVRAPVLEASNMFIPNPYYGFAEVLFVMRLNENIGIKGVPDEILVFTFKSDYFGVGDKVTLQGRILKGNFKQWSKPIYIIFADRFYNESLQIGDAGLIERTLVVYEGMIRGLATRESRAKVTEDEIFIGTYFAVKLEGDIGIGEISDEIPVLIEKPCCFEIGDKVVLKGKIVKKYFRHGSKPMFVIVADHYYNESLQTSDEGLGGIEQVLYEGFIRGSVTGEPRARFLSNGDFYGVYFTMKLEENIGIKRLPDEILVRSKKQGYFRKGDEVIFQGKIIKKEIEQWGKLTYIIDAEDFPYE